MITEKRDITEDESGVHLATVTPASAHAVGVVLSAAMDNDGRSNWVWIRLANGDLILGVYPKGDTYLAVTGLENV